MGITQVKVTVSSPTDANRRWGGSFLVDTGAIDCYVPGNRLREIGIQPEGRRIYELVDGSTIALDVGVAQIEFMGEVVGGTVIFGVDHAESRLGMTALQSAGIEVDPRNQQLRRLPSVRLKKLC